MTTSRSKGTLWLAATCQETVLTISDMDSIAITLRLTKIIMNIYREISTSDDSLQSLCYDGLAKLCKLYENLITGIESARRTHTVITATWKIMPAEHLCNGSPQPTNNQALTNSFFTIVSLADDKHSCHHLFISCLLSRINSFFPPAVDIFLAVIVTLSFCVC